MKSLDEIGLTAGVGGDKASDRHNYLNRYEPFFEPFRELPIRLLEIGIENGYSVRIWLEYFPRATIYGVDLLSQPFEDGRFKFMQGDQNSVEFWNVYLGRKEWGFDIIIDDGSHRTKGIVTSFHMLFPALKSGGYYIIEDLSTAYMKGYQDEGYASQMEAVFDLAHHMNSQLAYRPPHWEPLLFPAWTTTDFGIDWIQLSEELAIIKKK